MHAGGRRARLQTQLEEIITLIVHTVNDNKDHIPPVVNNNVLPFPYELKVGQCAPHHAAAAHHLSLAAWCCLHRTWSTIKACGHSLLSLEPEWCLQGGRRAAHTVTHDLAAKSSTHAGLRTVQQTKRFRSSISSLLIDLRTAHRAAQL